MSFGAPGYLLFLLLVPAAAAALIYGSWWQQRARMRFGGLAAPTVLTYMVPLLLLLALVTAAVAAGRPQIGSNRVQSEDRGIDLVVVLDVSQSMLADDVQPSRLARAQQEIAAMLDRMHGDRTGLVIFARQPFVRSPLTSDLRAVQQIVAGVDHERGLVAPGSDLGAGIVAAHHMLAGGDAQTKAMLVVSDGEDHGQGIAAALTNARAAGIRVYTAGAGTPGGAPVRDVDGATGRSVPRVDASGNAVVTKLDADALRQLARNGGGRYIELAGDGRPLAGLATELASLTATTFGTRESSTPIERFQLVAALALLLLLAEPLGEATRAALRIRLNRAARWWPLAGAGLLLGAICSSGVAEMNRRGNDAYDRQQFSDAIDQYHTAEAIAPSRPELSHNAGNAYDRQGDFAHAIDETKRALDAAAGTGIEPLAEYGLGNHYAGAGDLQRARDAYKRALLADPNDGDAKHNLELVELLLHASPTATPPARSEATPTPAASPGEANNAGTPGSGTGRPTSGTPASGSEGTPSAANLDDLTPEQLQQRLNEALSGIDAEFTQEDAIRILDLLDRANRKANEQHAGTGGGAAPPDY